VPVSTATVIPGSRARSAAKALWQAEDNGAHGRERSTQRGVGSQPSYRIPPAQLSAPQARRDRPWFGSCVTGFAETTPRDADRGGRRGARRSHLWPVPLAPTRRLVRCLSTYISVGGRSSGRFFRSAAPRGTPGHGGCPGQQRRLRDANGGERPGRWHSVEVFGRASPDTFRRVRLAASRT
jgi:hypothetical protein